MTEALPPWRPLLRGARQRRSLPQARWLQLATLGCDGAPRVRTLVFRGWGGPAQLDLLTDRRSEKSTELMQEPRVELCWLLPKARSQFRLRGHRLSLDAASDQNARAQHWQQLHPGARSLWGWPQPGAAFDLEGPFPEASATKCRNPRALNWCALSSSRWSFWSSPATRINAGVGGDSRSGSRNASILELIGERLQATGVHPKVGIAQARHRTGLKDATAGVGVELQIVNKTKERAAGCRMQVALVLLHDLGARGGRDDGHQASKAAWGSDCSQSIRAQWAGLGQGRALRFEPQIRGQRADQMEESEGEDQEELGDENRHGLEGAATGAWEGRTLRSRHRFQRSRAAGCRDKPVLRSRAANADDASPGLFC